VLLGEGAEERVRPGVEKGSEEDSFPHRLPMVGNIKRIYVNSGLQW